MFGVDNELCLNYWLHLVHPDGSWREHDVLASGRNITAPFRPRKLVQPSYEDVQDTHRDRMLNAERVAALTQGCVWALPPLPLWLQREQSLHALEQVQFLFIPGPPPNQVVRATTCVAPPEMLQAGPPTRSHVPLPPIRKIQALELDPWPPTATVVDGLLPTLHNPQPPIPQRYLHLAVPPAPREPVTVLATILFESSRCPLMPPYAPGPCVSFTLADGTQSLLWPLVWYPRQYRCEYLNEVRNRAMRDYRINQVRCQDEICQLTAPCASCITHLAATFFVPPCYLSVLNTDGE